MSTAWHSLFHSPVTTGCTNVGPAGAMAVKPSVAMADGKNACVWGGAARWGVGTAVVDPIDKGVATPVVDWTYVILKESNTRLIKYKKKYNNKTAIAAYLIYYLNQIITVLLLFI